MHRSLTILLAVLASTAHAQTADDIYDLPEIVLTPNLTPQEKSRTGVSVSVLDDTALRAAGQVPLLDTLARLPGVHVSANGGFGQLASIRVRGADERYVPVYIDGVQVADPSGATVGFDFGQTLTSDISRIEVLSGSQSALYGGSAVGGVIAITTRQPQREGQTHAASVEIGSHDTRAASYSYGLKTDRTEQAVTLSHLHTGGISATRSGTERDAAEATRLSWSGSIAARDDLTVGASAFHQRGWADYDGYDQNFALADADNRAHRRETGGGVFAQYTVGDSTHILDATAYDIDRRYVTDLDETRFEGGRQALRYRGTTRVSDRLTLVYGADTTREIAETGALGGEISSRTNGAFAEAIATQGVFNLSASLRRDHNSDFGSYSTARVAVAAQLGDTTLRGAASTGFRAPSLAERYDDYGYYTGNPDLDPEESTSVEIGIDHDYGIKGRVSATLFQIHTDNLITYTDAVFPNTVVNVSGQSVRKGLELSGTYAMSDLLTGWGSYTYLDGTAASGARLSRIPRHDLALGVDASFGAPAGEAGETTAGVSLRHASGIVDAGELPGFSVVDARMSYRLNGAVAYLRAENIFDKDYEVVRGYSTQGRTLNVGLRADF